MCGIAQNIKPLKYNLNEIKRVSIKDEKEPKPVRQEWLNYVWIIPAAKLLWDIIKYFIER